MRFPRFGAGPQRPPHAWVPRYVRTPIVLIVVGILGLAGGLHTAAPSGTKCPPKNRRCNTTSTTTTTTSTSSTTPTTPTTTTTPASSDLLFDDEFNGPAGSQPSAPWTILAGADPPRWGQECFVGDTRHIAMDGQGNLALTATYDPSGVPCTNGAGPYESGGIWTDWADFSFQYGTMEARIKVPCQSGTGVWPAWWAYGQNWPTGGEIDNLEVMWTGVPTPGQDAHQTVHGPKKTGSEWAIGNDYSYADQLCNAFHTYGAIWSQGQIQFTFDGTVTRTITPSDLQSGWVWPFDTYAERPVLDLQVGDWGGTVDPTTLPQTMLVDYVRIYRSSSQPPPSTTTSTTTTTTTPTTTTTQTPTGSDPVIAGAGDICGSGSDCAATADLLQTIAPTAVFTTGDNEYSSGTLSEYNAYYDPNWGRFKSITHPAPGNHDYYTSGAAGYFSYFGAQAPAPYYSYDLGSWHVIALASKDGVSPLAGDAEETWLRSDLAAHPNKCTLVYWHEPRFSSGADHGNDPTWSDVWNDLYAAHVDVVLNGHDHNYQRFGLLNPAGNADASGIREFVVGTGGESHYGFVTSTPMPQVRNDTDFGVLKLTLHASSYDWQFIPVAGGSFTDSGSTACS